jgi:ribonuclease Z
LPGSKFELTVLGSNSAIPTANRHPSAHLLNVNERFYLIDCGEGTQIQLRKYGFKFQRIGHIFISHLHGDHFFGLIGLITTMNLLGREKPLTIHAHKELQELITYQLKVSKSWIDFEIHYNHLPVDNQIILDDGMVTVQTVPLSHRIPCCGFVFREKVHDRKLLMPVIENHNIPVVLLKGIKEGNDFVARTGKVIPNSELTLAAPPSRSFGYCTDTKYKEDIVPLISNVDLLYHESTFTEEHKERAKKTYHCTAKDAATIAKLANVSKLLLGHYSVRYKSLTPLLAEARAVFDRSALSVEGETYCVG